MQRRRILAASAAAALGLAVLSSSALPQQQQPPRQQQAAPPQQPPSIKASLPGAWNLLLVDQVKEDGTHVPLYGPNPEGILIFTADGHYALEIFRVNRPNYPSPAAGGTPEQNKAVLTGMISHFGTYTVDESSKAVTMHLEGSSYPNWDGTKQTRIVTAITNEVLTYNIPTLPGEPAGDHGELAWKKLK